MGLAKTLSRLKKQTNGRQIVSLVLLVLVQLYVTEVVNVFGADPACGLRLINPKLIESLLLAALVAGTVVGAVSFKSSSLVFKILFALLVLVSLPWALLLLGFLAGSGCF
jgi:hypothetical protein